jgi:hypothetical protein
MKFTLTFAFISSVAINAFAVRLQPPTPCEWYAVHHGQPTFVGTALSEEMVPDVLQAGRYAIPVTVQKVTFRVDEAFERTPGTIVNVYGSGTTNDVAFKVGTQYLVYGFRDTDGKIRTGKCTRTAPVIEATEDLKFLRLLRTRVGGAIVGLVSFVSPGLQTESVSGTITAPGMDGDHKTRVASSGWYQLSGLAPGNYRETFVPDDNATQFISFKLNVPVDGSCASSGVRLGNLTVAGNVIDGTGKPVSDSDMFLYYALDGHFHPEVALETHADKSGKFSFHRVEAAKFILSARTNSDTIFFPGTRDADKAQTVEVRDGEPLSGLIIVIPGSLQSKVP